MTRLRAVLLAPPGTQPKLLRWHHVWLAFALTGLGFCVGVLTLMLAATAYLKLDSTDLFLSLFPCWSPMLLLLNVLPPILLILVLLFSYPLGLGQLFLGQLPPLCGTGPGELLQDPPARGTLCWPPTCAWSLRRGGSWDTISWT